MVRISINRIKMSKFNSNWYKNVKKYCMSNSVKRQIIKNKLEIESLQEKPASLTSVSRRSLNLPPQ